MPTAFAMGISSVATRDRSAGSQPYGRLATPMSSLARYAAHFLASAGPIRAAVPVPEDRDRTSWERVSSGVAGRR
ncbi:hypothetical protein GCM10010505_04680 [Kitasatospora aburaviensis]